MSEDSSPTSEDDLIRRLETSRENAKTTLDKQFQQINGLDQKAVELIKINAVVSGIFLAGISFAIRTATGKPVPETEVANQLNLYLLIGLGLLVASAASAAISYGPQGLVIGPSESFLRKIVEETKEGAEEMKKEERSQLDFQQDLTLAYASYLESNNSTQVTKAFLTSVSVLLIIYGSIFLILGILTLLNVQFLDIILSSAIVAIFVTSLLLGIPIVQMGRREFRYIVRGIVKILRGKT